MCLRFPSSSPWFSHHFYCEADGEGRARGVYLHTYIQIGRAADGDRWRDGGGAARTYVGGGRGEGDARQGEVKSQRREARRWSGRLWEYIHTYVYTNVCTYVCTYVCSMYMYVCMYIYSCRYHMFLSICMVWYVCMYVCTYVCMYVCMYIWMNVHMYSCMDICMYEMYVCTYICMYVCMYVCNLGMYVHMYVHMYVCMYVCMYVRMYWVARAGGCYWFRGRRPLHSWHGLQLQPASLHLMYVFHYVHIPRGGTLVKECAHTWCFMCAQPCFFVLPLEVKWIALWDAGSYGLLVVACPRYGGRCTYVHVVHLVRHHFRGVHDLPYPQIRSPGYEGQFLRFRGCRPGRRVCSTSHTIYMNVCLSVRMAV